MLKSLSIKNIAVIENVNIEFGPGFNVLTGETGAGKSIIIDSINLLKGERIGKGIVRNGETKARVDAVLDIDREQAMELSEILGMDVSEEIMLSRELTSEGKSTCRIDGTPVTVAMLKMVGDTLINIHGQHDNTSLLVKKSHLGLLDNFGGEDIALARRDYSLVHEGYKEVTRLIEETDIDEKEQARRAELLRYSIQEIEMSELYEGEDKELEDRKNLLRNSYKIASATQGAYESLYDGENGERSSYDALWSALKLLEGITGLDERLSRVYDVLSDCGDAIAENARFLKDYCEDVESTSGELDSIEDRLRQIDDLKHKYGTTIEDILRKCVLMQEELEGITCSKERLNELLKEQEKLEKDRRIKAENLTTFRKKYAAVLSQRVAGELAGLCMPGVNFDTGFEDVACRNDGADDVEFLICTNTGEGLKPLSRIASGGELSRIMLAIKSVLAGCEGEKLLIFDEVDSGVSGAAAQSIGEKLWKTSRYSQVICITHLPQIAAMADNHYLIQKTTDGVRTRTHVTPAEGRERIEEIARTLGGANITDAAIQNAGELVRLADEFKGENNG